MTRRQRALSLATGIVLLLATGWSTPACSAEDPAPRILTIRRDADELWLASTTGLWQLDGERRVRHVFRAGDGLPSDVVVDVARTGAGELWAATIYGPARLAAERFQTMTNGLQSTDITCLLATRGGALYAGTGRGIAQWEGERWQPRYETHQFGRDRVVAATEGPDGTLWFAKSGSLTMLSPEQNWRVLWRDPLNPDLATLLPSTAAEALAFDADGRLWIATDAGVSVLKGLSLERHERWRPPPWGVDGLPGARVWAIHHAHDGTVWLSFGDGPEPGFVARRKPSSPHWQRIPIGDSPAKIAGYTFAEDQDGALWLGTSAGLYRWSDTHFENWPLTP